MSPDDRLELNARTVFDGIAFLLKQIKDHAPHLQPDLCVGINHAGALVASYIAGSLRGGVKHLGFVATQGPDHDIPPAAVCLPPAGRRGTIREILLVDLEVKRGKSIRHVVELLRSRYASDQDGELTIRIAVLVASLVPRAIGHVDRLRRGDVGIFEEDAEYLPDFLAFVCRNKVHLTGGIG